MNKTYLAVGVSDECAIVRDITAVIVEAINIKMLLKKRIREYIAPSRGMVAILSNFAGTTAQNISNESRADCKIILVIYVYVSTYTIQERRYTIRVFSTYDLSHNLRL